MSSAFLPLIEQLDDKLIICLARLGPLIVSAHQYSAYPFPDSSTLYVLLDNQSNHSVDQIISWLDAGVDKIIVPLSWAKELTSVLPSDRLILLLDVANVSAVSENVRKGVSGVLLKTPIHHLDLISSVSQFFSGSSIYVLPAALASPSKSTIREISNAGASLVISTTQLSPSPSTNDHINIADAFLATIASDRPDGLYPTVVSSYAQGNTCLGLVYSSYESVKESILTGKGVYQSRKHGLWRKGETSGAVQDVVRIRLDCDSDALQFSVIQHGDGFCHLARQSCFGQSSGLIALEQTLRARLENAPEGSYTARLFNDPNLLKAKIMEEADELCSATTPKEVAFEAADLLYFALTRCVSAGVGLSDIERSLDLKAKKVTRRKGDAKSRWTPKTETTKTHETESIDDSSPIRMRTFDLSSSSPLQRADLLRRPVLRSGEMISKVQPIVDDVRIRGDAALLELTAKFDKASLTSPVILPPFAPKSMQLETSVRDAIDKAYANIRKFHQAQAEKDMLVVETMPGVVCSRFARPIARVGLYVPGGTAILPSTALMLGIPAQVAGCKEIVLATPPRADGSISPEVMYAAYLVGASAVLKAGGAQAVAAMAYGTQSVPKVDKIFGPGNQWVTAAKMLVQNDTDALVSIDMPAGPSEVLVSFMHFCSR
jgi:phosphoribosyl-ATP pyrophosphohydrolase / phosphoribosyl-AMP cyclohydrolase / histidinol dehydrogenase